MPRANLKPEIERFWEKVNKNGPTMLGMTTPCWAWIAYIDHCGYGTFRFYGKDGKAHRFSYLLHNGTIPEGIEVRHICHNPACVNPEHLQLGTHIDNMNDLAISGRRKGIRHKVKRQPKPKPSAEDRFWSKVNKDGPIMSHMTTPCWIWKTWINKDGYGRFSVSSKLILAHRFSYELSYGQIPDGLDILHKCDNPSCVNPEHLIAGTHQENMQDMIKKGRFMPRKGELNGCSKLTQPQVDEIRYRHKSTNVTQVQLARDYNVTQAAIWYILNGRNWASLT